MQPDIFELVAEARRRGIPAALATVVGARGSTPAKLAARMFVRIDGFTAGTIGGGCVEAEVVRTARDVVDTGVPRVLEFRLSGAEAERTGIACGGTVQIMIESLEDPRAIVIGAGHVGQTTARLAASAGFRITVVDDRPDFANRERFPDADAILVSDLDALPGPLQATPRTAVLIMTRGHSEDLQVLRCMLKTPARRIGVLGSRSKRIQFDRALLEEGFDAEDLARIQMPVGIDVGAETVEEIAVSIVAQLIRWRRLGEGTVA